VARLSRCSTPLLLCCLALLTGGCAFFGGGQQVNTAPGPTPTMQAPGTPAPPPPNGWFPALSGWRLMGVNVGGLTASYARPGRVVGCALPAGERSGKPIFALSDDAGHTWHASSIPGALAALQCSALADSQQPDTFVVDLAVASNPDLVYLTTDAGRTWQAVQGDASHNVRIYGGNMQLVAGHLIAVLAPQPGTAAASAWELSERNPDGTWHALDANLPHAHEGGGTQPPQAYAADAADPTHIYAAMPVGSTGMTLYGTRDEGATWHALYSWPTATRMALWTASGGKVFAQDLIDYGTANQFFYSPDGGATWVGSGLHHQGGVGADAIFPSASGRVVTLADQLIFNLDPTTGDFSTLAHDPRFTVSDNGAFTCAVVEGVRPTLLCADQYATYGMPLPPA
jgi:hypothetical protein